MIEIGIIGCGAMGRHHGEAYRQMENVRVAGVADLVEEQAKRLAADLEARPYADFRDMLPEVEAVVVCTPSFQRVDVVTECARAGKHVFSEKPLALNLADADRILGAVEAAGVKFMTGYVLRFTQPYSTLCETFNSGELGRLITCWTRRYMPCPLSILERWYGDQDKSGGVAVDFASHDIDLLRWIGGDVRTVFAHVARVRAGVRADEHAQALLTFKNGGMGAIDVSWSSWLDETSLGVIGSQGSMIVDRSGAVRKKIGDGKEEIVECASSMSVNPSGDLGAKDEEGHIRALASSEETIQQHFIRCIEQDLEPKTNGPDARAVLETALAIQESARTGKSVDLVG